MYIILRVAHISISIQDYKKYLRIILSYLNEHSISLKQHCLLSRSTYLLPKKQLFIFYHNFTYDIRTYHHFINTIRFNHRFPESI